MTHERFGCAGTDFGPATVVRAGNRLFLSAQSGIGLDGRFAGDGDAGAQADQAMRNVAELLRTAGSGPDHIAKLNTYITDRAYRRPVYEAIGRHLKGVHPCSTGLVVDGLARPELMMAVDVEAMIPDQRDTRRMGMFNMLDRPGEHAVDWDGCRIVIINEEVFQKGQTGRGFSHPPPGNMALTPDDAAAQAEIALTAVLDSLRQAGAKPTDVCKIRVYVSDRAYREAVYPVIGRHLAGVHPVSTGLIVKGFALPEIVMEIDVMTMRAEAAPHQRLRKFRTGELHKGRQVLGCDFCMAVRAGNRIFLRGQAGHTLDNRFVGHGDPGAQAEQAMDNVAQLLDDAGANLGHVCKVTTFVTDRAYLAPAREVVEARLAGVHAAATELIVRGLGLPEALVEIDVDAVIG